MTERGAIEWFYRLRDLIIPDECGSCGAKPPPGRPLCLPCGAVLRETEPVPRDVSGLPVAAAGRYGGVLRNCLLAYKQRARRDLAAPLARLMSLPLSAPDSNGPTVLVPVPSTRAARRSRGFDHLRELTSHLVRLLPGALWTPVLSVAARPDSAGLGRAERYRTARAAMRLNPHRAHRLRRVMGERESVRVVLVDDIVTSGATLSAADAKLAAAGIRVSGAVAGASADLTSI